MRKLQSQKDRNDEEEYRQRLKRMAAVIGGGIVLWLLITAVLFLTWREGSVPPEKGSGVMQSAQGSAEMGEKIAAESEQGMTPEGNRGSDSKVIPGTKTEGEVQISGQETSPPVQSQETNPPVQSQEAGSELKNMVSIKINGKAQDTKLKVLSETETDMVSLWDILNRFGYRVSVTKDQAYCTCLSQDQGEYNYIVVDYDGMVTMMEFDTGASGSRTQKLSAVPLITDGEMYVKAEAVSNLIPQKVKRVLARSDGSLEFCSPSYVQKQEDERRRKETVKKAAEESRKAAETVSKADEEPGKTAEEPGRAAEGPGKTADGTNQPVQEPGRTADGTNQPAQEPGRAAEGPAGGASVPPQAE